MASNQSSSSSGAAAAPPAVQEYIVRVPKESKKKFSIMKFAFNALDFTSCGPVKIERENNLREYKMSHDIDQMPKFGAGSEFGREAREEARRKKYGVNIKRYNPEDQPWLLKAGTNLKTCKKFKGVKEGGVLQNACYYVFTQCVDGAFEAFPVEEWYNLTPMARYKYLNSEEAEEEFERRDKTMNLFSVMVRKRLGKEDDDSTLDGEDGEKSKKGKKSKSSSDFMLTDLDEWAVLEKINDEDDDEEEDNSDSETPKKAKGQAGKNKKKKKDRDLDIEAEEDEDSVDEGQEVDYMTDTDSEDEDMYSEDVRRKGNDKYEEKGVEDAMASDEEAPEEEEKNKEEEEDEEKEEDKEAKPKKNNDSDSDLSGSSDSDSDPEKEPSLVSPLLMQKGAEKKKAEKGRRGSLSSESSAANSRSATPTKQKKRKLDESDSPGGSKKAKPEAREQMSTPLASEGVSEEAVRRYLMRKPMTVKDLLQKFKNAGLTKEKLVPAVVEILKKINPKKKKVPTATLR